MTWNPDTYSEVIRAEIADYDVLQNKVIEASAGPPARSILELGVGSGETAARLLQRHTNASLCGIDSSPEMLRGAGERLPENRVRLVERRLDEPLPNGPYDLVATALAVHHLEGRAKAALFRGVAAELEPGGRFVLGDVIVPIDAQDAVIEIEPDYDFPSTIEEQLEWLEEAGFEATVFWRQRDLAVLVGRRQGGTA